MTVNEPEEPIVQEVEQAREEDPPTQAPARCWM